MESIMDKNRLGEETSPYLLQHKDNPVHWRAWNPETLAAAKEADKPILLSVGYAACHWCHVMAHESFENPEIAARYALLLAMWTLAALAVLLLVPWLARARDRR